jgi:L-alanine-DL-glutamate epimerase-like enolase superfamily enzyme
MKITNIKAISFKLPLVEPLKWATGYAEHAAHVLIRISTDEEIEGIGEAVPRPTIYGETQESIVKIVNDHLGPMLVGEDPMDLEKVWAKMATVIWNPVAKGAIDVALHDIIGKKCGSPCYKLMGGWTDKVPLTWMVALKSVDEMVEEAKAKFADGFKSFKLKGGIDPDLDIKMFRRIREALGTEARLYIDANQGYSFSDAVKVLSALENELACCEEPMPAWDRQGRKKLAQLVRVPILGDESIFTVQELAQQIELGAISIVMIKIPRTGYYLSHKMVVLAETYNMPMHIGTQAETSLGCVAGAQFAAAFKQISLPNEISYYQCVRDSLLTTEPVVEDGCMLLPSGPGLGVELDEDKVNYYTLK